MRIREIYIHNFRSFRGPHRISFVNPVTEQVNPVSVIAGPNGSGKSTILETIGCILEYAVTELATMKLAVQGNPNKTSSFVQELLATGLICLSIEIEPNDYSGVPLTIAGEPAQDIVLPTTTHIAIGKRSLLPANYESIWPNLAYQFSGDDEPLSGLEGLQKSAMLTLLGSSVFSQQAKHGHAFTGGFVFLPHDRQLSSALQGSIEPPPDTKTWISRFANSDTWGGSLQQFWIWQNYLDLEEGNDEHSTLGSFVESVESILGRDRKIKVERGQVTIPAGWSNGSGEEHRISLDQLPSGEQQVLLLFGELARRRRRGGMIAIDEIENSLHPTMQRLVMANLKKIARDWDSQVIVTTHSSDVLNSVRGSAAILLGDLHQPTNTNGYHNAELEESPS